MKKFATVSVAVLLVAGCGTSPSLKASSRVTPVSAQSQASFNALIKGTRAAMRLQFDEADRDKNAFLTLNESGGGGKSYVLGQQPIGTFAEVDTDHDGKLSFDEVTATPIVMRTAQRLHDQLLQMFASADRDGDMVLRGAEIPVGYDLNKDGRITFDAYESAYAAMMLKATGN